MTTLIATGLTYHCTHMEKEAEEDNFEEGVVGDRHCVMETGCDIQANSLKELVAKVAADYGLELNDLWVPDDDGEVTYFGFNRLENDDGSEPSERELQSWRGETPAQVAHVLLDHLSLTEEDEEAPKRHRLWLCEYTFHIEKRFDSLTVTKQEFIDAGIKFHD